MAQVFFLILKELYRVLTTKSLLSDVPQNTGSLCPGSNHYFYVSPYRGPGNHQRKQSARTAVFQALSQTGSP